MARGRAANGSGTQPRLRSDGRWECRYQLGTNPRTGKVVMKSVYGKTSEECAKKLRAATAAIDDGSYIEPSKMLLEEWLNIWISEYCLDIKERTKNTYRGTINAQIVPALGAIPLCELQPHKVQRFINNLVEGGGISTSTIKNVHGILHHALKKAVQLRYIRDNPANGCSLPRLEKKEIGYLSRDELALVQGV